MIHDAHCPMWLPIISQQPNRLLNYCQLEYQQHKHSHCSLSLFRIPWCPCLLFHLPNLTRALRHTASLQRPSSLH